MDTATNKGLSIEWKGTAGSTGGTAIVAFDGLQATIDMREFKQFFELDKFIRHVRHTAAIAGAKEERLRVKRIMKMYLEEV